MTKEASRAVELEMGDWEKKKGIHFSKKNWEKNLTFDCVLALLKRWGTPVLDLRGFGASFVEEENWEAGNQSTNQSMKNRKGRGREKFTQIRLGQTERNRGKIRGFFGLTSFGSKSEPKPVNIVKPTRQLIDRAYWPIYRARNEIVVDFCCCCCW